MSFAHTEYLLLLLLLIPAVLLYVFNRRWKQQTLRKLGDVQLVQQLTAGYAPRKAALRFWLVFAALAFTALGAANLRMPGKGEATDRKGRDIIIALDVSRSMMADDIKPNRLEKARRFVNKLLDALPNERTGLIFFAGKAYLSMPLTADAGAARLFLQSANPDVVPTQGTVIAEALQLAAQSFPTESKRYKIVVLITDGEDHDEAALERAAWLKEQGILLLTLGLGTPAGAPIPEPDGTGFKKDRNGQTIVSKLNETLLRRIAAANGGMYGNLQDAGAMVTDITKVINQLEARGGTTPNTTANYRYFFQWFLALAILLLVAAFFITEIRKP